jgi:AraC family transcriptional regulator, transcriptional activator of pobA
MMATGNTKSLQVGLYGEESSPFLPDFVHCELLETRSGLHDWEINSHVHPQLCQVFLLESGNGILKTNQHEIVLPIPCLLFIPENTPHGFSYQSDSQGRVLTLSVSFIEDLFKTIPEVLLTFENIQIIDSQVYNFKFEELKNQFRAIHEELYEAFPQRDIALQARLLLLLIELFRLSDKNTENVKIIDRNLNYYQDFQRLIKKNYLSQTSLSDYANQLNITTIHLNRICQNVVGKTASEVLQEYIVYEAKKYLKHTSYSISEIAYRLNFEYPSYFTRLFKKHTGLSPKGFREEDK